MFYIVYFCCNIKESLKLLFKLQRNIKIANLKHHKIQTPITTDHHRRLKYYYQTGLEDIS